MKQLWEKSVLVFALSCWSIFALAEPKLTFTSWNMQWLTTQPKAKIADSQRSEQDFAALADKFRRLDADILAFQEVDSIAAIKKVVGPFYHIRLSDRADSNNKQRQFDDLNQYTGFAIAKRYTISDPQDIDLLPQQMNKLRFATYVVLKQIGAPDVHLLSVHLKQGCRSAKRNSDSCRILQQQARQLNQWMKQKLTANQSFILAGDFNHDLQFRNDWLWLELNKGIDKQIELASSQTDALCQVRSKSQPNQSYRYPSLIDHIIISRPSHSSVAKQSLYSRQQQFQFNLSDHCPLSAQIEVRPISRY